MRRFFLILMIALLPLRGWVGDAMAMEMLVQHPIAMQNIAASADKSSASDLFDTEMQAECPGHAESTTPASDTDNTSGTRPNHCGSCPLCQICHTVAAPAPWSIQPSGWLSHTLPDVAHTRFASAPAAFALKPPIS